MPTFTVAARWPPPYIANAARCLTVFGDWATPGMEAAGFFYALYDFPMTHVYRWKRYRPELYGQRCRVVIRGRMNSCLVEFEDGTRHICSRYAVRKAK